MQENLDMKSIEHALLRAIAASDYQPVTLMAQLGLAASMAFMRQDLSTLSESFAHLQKLADLLSLSYPATCSATLIAPSAPRSADEQIKWLTDQLIKANIEIENMRACIRAAPTWHLDPFYTPEKLN